MLTVKQITRALESLADAHDQVGSFHFGDPPEFGAESAIDYPFMGGFIVRSRLETRTLVTEMSLFLCDLVDTDEANETEVLSDTQRTLLGVFAQFKNYLFQNDARIVDTATLSPFTEKFDDMATGWQLDFSFNQVFTSDACAEPSTYDPEREISGDVRIYNITTGATIEMVQAGGDYGVLVFSGISDDGPPYTNSIVDNT